MNKLLIAFLFGAALTACGSHLSADEISTMTEEQINQVTPQQIGAMTPGELEVFRDRRSHFSRERTRAEKEQIRNMEYK